MVVLVLVLIFLIIQIYGGKIDMGKKKGLLFGTEVFHTKKGLDTFKKELKQRNIGFSTREVRGGHQIQWYKKRKRGL